MTYFCLVKLCRSIVYLPILLIYFFQSVYANTFSDSSITDHKILIERLGNSQERLYNAYLNSYNNYLTENPNDVKVALERCQFVQNALYDDYEDYNPNQEYFDSISNLLFENFPNHPSVLIYQTSFTWGEEYNEALDMALDAIATNDSSWSNTDKADIYFKKAKSLLDSTNYREARNFMDIACEFNPSYQFSLDNIKLHVALEANDEATKCLLMGLDSIERLWELNQIIKIFSDLKDYPNALKACNKLNSLDSTYISNSKMAIVLEGINEYDVARTYRVKDTSSYWASSDSKLELFKHDLKYQDQDLVWNSFYAYRDGHYERDPLALYRIQLFLNRPFLSWKIADFAGILTLLFIGLILFFVPSIWVLPVYVIGHRWKIFELKEQSNFLWGLKSFWWVSLGYILGSFFSTMVDVEFINSLINWIAYEETFSNEQQATSDLIFMSFMAVFGLTSLYISGPKVLLSKNYSIGKCLKAVMALFIGFKLLSVIYMYFGMAIFDLSRDEIYLSTPLFSIKESVINLITVHGALTTFLIIAIIVPIYEEVIFRGVILNACSRYLQFKWTNIFQSALFALIHDSLFWFPVYMGFGLLCGILVKRTGGIWPSIVFHILNNALAFWVINNQIS